MQSGGNNLAEKKTALKVLQRGDVLGLFPEGRIYQSDKLGPFNLGWAYFAINSGASIVPVVIKGTSAMMPKGKFFPRRAKIYIQIGAPWRIEPTLTPKQESYPAMNKRLNAGRATLVQEAIQNGS